MRELPNYHYTLKFNIILHLHFFITFGTTTYVTMSAEQTYYHPDNIFFYCFWSYRKTKSSTKD